MKPFTLEWWLAKMRYCVQIAASDVFHEDYRAIHHKLANWIERRILRKYGERAE